MNKFSNAKIYKVTDVNNNESYYGSTINSLSLRKALHKNSYKKYKNGEFNKISIFDLFDKYGVDNCEIELVEEFPCENKIELLNREGFYIKNNECVNKTIAGRTLKEYYADNKEKYRQHNQEYYANNKEKISNHMKTYYQANKERIRQRQKIYFLRKVIEKLQQQNDDLKNHFINKM
jgi:hypothetical protein